MLFLSFAPCKVYLIMNTTTIIKPIDMARILRKFKILIGHFPH